MRALLTELRLKDYITIGLIFLALFVIMNLQNFINDKLPKINLADYDIELQAKIKSYKPIQLKSETLEGSKLKRIGNNVEIEFYYLDSSIVNNTIIVKYNSYEVNKTVIDNMILNKEKILPIRINKMDSNKIVLNYRHKE